VRCIFCLSKKKCNFAVNILRRRRRILLQPSEGWYETIMNWIILIIAGLCECGFTFCLGMAKTTEGIISKLWLCGFVFSLFMSMVLLMKATQTLPLGTAYPIWTGIGAVGTVLLGIFVFNEPITFWRVFFISTLILSVFGLKSIGS